MVNRLNAKNKLTGNEVIFVIIMTFIAAAIFCVLCQFVYYANANVENVQLNFVQYLCFCGVVLSIFAALIVFIYCNDVELLKDKRKLLALFTSMIISLAIIIAITNISDIGYSIYFAPLALCTLLCAMLTNSKVSYFANIVVLIIFNIAEIRFTSISGAELYYPLINGVITGIIGSFSISKYNRRAQYLLSGSITGFVSIFIATITLLLFGDGAIGDIKAYMFICLFSLLSGLINTALFFLLIPLIENIFNIVTDFRLAELASSNQPLMKRMFKEAPGTFHHSLLVASYTEACAGAIGENTFLARAAGYYHDIGKLKDPKYFVENQRDEHNPHDDISPELSVRVIKKHIIDGRALALEYKLPKEIQLAIREHHGTMPIVYFYHKAKRLTESGNLDSKAYSYDGPKPTNKIDAILMIADASEAALRAAGSRNDAAQIVDRIIQERLQLGQFSDCDITMKELEIIKQTIISTYLGSQHERIRYPGQK